MRFLEVFSIKTDLIGIGDDMVEALEKGLRESGLTLEDGDILVVSESAVATWEGRVVNLDDVKPGRLACNLAVRYSKDPRDMELILRESEEIVGGIPGVVLTMNKGFLYPNAGIDHSNAPPGYVVLFPADSQKSASIIRDRMARGKKIGVIVGDSRTHPLRLGCVGVALGCVGLEPVEDARGQKDLYGRPLNDNQEGGGRQPCLSGPDRHGGGRRGKTGRHSQGGAGQGRRGLEVRDTWHSTKRMHVHRSSALRASSLHRKL